MVALAPYCCSQPSTSHVGCEAPTASASAACSRLMPLAGGGGWGRVPASRRRAISLRQWGSGEGGLRTGACVQVGVVQPACLLPPHTFRTSPWQQGRGQRRVERADIVR